MMTQLYSHNGAYPRQLPKRHIMPDGSTRTSLHEVDQPTLSSWGYEPVDVAPTPSDTQVLEWQNPNWVLRDKTAEELAAEALAKREAMAPARWAFANAAFANGIITAEEAKQWANGNALPAGMDAAIDAAITDPAQLTMAKVQALAAPTVHRLNPMIAILQASENMTDEQADALFQVAIAIEKGE